MLTFHLRYLVAIVAVSIVQAKSPNSQPVPASAGQKTHTLFMGADVSVELEKAFHRVQDVSRSSWVVTLKGRPEFIPTTQRSLNLRVEKSLKLTHANATVANFKSERAYTMGNDPKMRALQTQVQTSAFFTEQAMVAERDFLRAQQSAVWGGMADPRNPQAGPKADPAAALDQMSKAQSLATSEIASSQFHQRIAEEQEKAENFDAIRVEFELSAEKRLLNPYVIVVAQIREPRAAPGMFRNWIYAQSLDPIDEEPTKIELLHGGFPIGYSLEKVDVHVYDRGREVATNLSPKRVPLTREEAFQYLVIEHIGSNKGKTLPAYPVMVEVSPELKTRLGVGQGQQVYYATVSKDGLVKEAFEDAGHSRKITDPFFEKTVKGIWFKPALEAGKPVETKTQIDLTKLPL